MNFTTILATDLRATRESCDPNNCNALRSSAPPLTAQWNGQFAVCHELIKRAIAIYIYSRSARLRAIRKRQNYLRHFLDVFP